MYGVIIDKGLADWQVLQQENGFADAFLSGSLHLEDEIRNKPSGKIIVRAIDENNGARIGEAVTAALEGNAWHAVLRLPAGGPYRIESFFRYEGFRERRGDRVFHVGVGDVFLIAGQSNAVGVGKDEAPDPIDVNVHAFRLCGKWDIASHPLHDSTNTLFPLNRELCQTGHSPWLAFGKTLSRALGYPIGLIPGTKGGIPLSYWDRKEDGAFFDNALKIVEASGSKIRGILWYQGCNDAYNPLLRDTYLQRFQNVCADFERSFFAGIPVFTVQLNKVVCTYGMDIDQRGKDFAVIREAQRQAMLTMSNVYMVPSIDLMVCDGIHNASISNLAIGERVANQALHYLYGKEIACDAPDIISATLLSETCVSLRFSHVSGVLYSDNFRIEDLMFSLTDESGTMVPVDYLCPGDDTMQLMFNRAIGERAYVSCDRYNDNGLMPYDLETYLPVIPFSGVPVSRLV